MECDGGRWDEGRGIRGRMAVEGRTIRLAEDPVTIPT